MDALFRVALACVVAAVTATSGFQLFPFVMAWVNNSGMVTAASLMGDVHQMAREPGAITAGGFAVTGSTLTYDGTTLTLYRGLPMQVNNVTLPFAATTSRSPWGAVKVFVNGSVLRPPWAILETSQGLVMALHGTVSPGSVGTDLPNACQTLTFSPTSHLQEIAGDASVDCTTGVVNGSPTTN